MGLSVGTLGLRPATEANSHLTMRNLCLSFLSLLFASLANAQFTPAATSTVDDIQYRVSADKGWDQNFGQVTLDWAVAIERGRAVKSAVIRTGKTRTVGEVLQGLAQAFHQAGTITESATLYEIGHLDHGGRMRVEFDAPARVLRFIYEQPDQPTPFVVLFEKPAIGIFAALLAEAAKS